jgi:hypothetical protein
MTERYEDVNSVMADIESQMALVKLAQRGEYAAGIALLSGDILKTAVASGVPSHMAEEMAADFWKAEMLADTVAALLRDATLEEDEE